MEVGCWVKKNVQMIMKFQELDLRYKYFEKIYKGSPPSPQARLLGFSQKNSL